MVNLVEMAFHDGSKGLVNTETGEVRYEIQDVVYPNVQYRKSIDEVDTTVPGELGEWVEEKGYKLTQDVTDIVTDISLSDKEMRVLLYIGSKVEGQNTVFTTVKDVMDDLGLTKGQVSKILHSLEDKKYIILEHRNTFGVGSRVVAVNPRYFWKGNYGTRNVYQMNWVRNYTVDQHEVLYSCPLPEDYYKEM